jgi:hypothetical protein
MGERESSFQSRRFCLMIMEGPTRPFDWTMATKARYRRHRSRAVNQRNLMQVIPAW